MNVPAPWLECLRLQGRAESQWLRLRGYAPELVPRLIEERAQFRVETVDRWSQMILDEAQLRNQALKTPELVARYTQAKADLEAQHDLIEERIRRLQNAVWRLRAPTLILTRRVKVFASPEVEALIARKADRVGVPSVP
ncbi:hypothetical protein PM082_020224 [Marasmius tenuissimus]|nr:hypothetical protein PM082_020224 [Marasmius tenuissimus]